MGNAIQYSLIQSDIHRYVQEKENERKQQDQKEEQTLESTFNRVEEVITEQQQMNKWVEYCNSW